MTPDQIPAELAAMLDKDAGKVHGDTGSVRTSLARILTRHEEMVRNTAEPITEYAVLMSGGGWHVRPDYPDMEQAYPLCEWIADRKRRGGRVAKRVVIVVEDWEEL